MVKVMKDHLGSQNFCMVLYCLTCGKQSLNSMPFGYKFSFYSLYGQKNKTEILTRGVQTYRYAIDEFDISSFYQMARKKTMSIHNECTKLKLLRTTEHKKYRHNHNESRASVKKWLKEKSKKGPHILLNFFRCKEESISFSRPWKDA